MHLQETHGGTDIRSKSSGLWWPVYIGRAEQSCAYDVRYPYYADSTSRGEVKFVLWSTDCSGLNSAAAKQLLPMQDCRVRFIARRQYLLLTRLFLFPCASILTAPPPNVFVFVQGENTWAQAIGWPFTRPKSYNVPRSLGRIRSITH